MPSDGDMTGSYLDRDYLAAISLALQAAADEKAAVTVIQAIIDGYGSFDGKRSEPVQILLDAIMHVDGRFTT